MLKKTLVICFVSLIALLTVACSDDSEDTCEHLNEICASKMGYQKIDCSTVNSKYDSASDAEKEKSDKVNECINDTDSCDTAIACATK
jgi:hypothetical protein